MHAPSGLGLAFEGWASNNLKLGPKQKLQAWLGPGLAQSRASIVDVGEKSLSVDSVWVTEGRTGFSCFIMRTKV